MSYNSIASMHDNAHLKRRLYACASQEGKNVNQPEVWVDTRMWEIVISPDWATSWDYALATNNPDPGTDPGVITDGMILAAIQPMP